MVARGLNPGTNEPPPSPRRAAMNVKDAVLPALKGRATFCRRSAAEEL